MEYTLLKQILLIYLFFDYIDLKIVSNEITNNLLEFEKLGHFDLPSFEDKITELKIESSQYKGYKWKFHSKKFWSQYKMK